MPRRIVDTAPPARSSRELRPYPRVRILTAYPRRSQNPRQHQHHRRLARAARRDAAHADHRMLQPLLLQPSPAATSASSPPAPLHTTEPAAAASGSSRTHRPTASLQQLHQRLHRPRRRSRLRFKHRPPALSQASRLVPIAHQLNQRLRQLVSGATIRIASCLPHRLHDLAKVLITTPPSPPARQTAPAPADYAHPSPPGSHPQTPPPPSEYTDARSPIVSSSKNTPRRNRSAAASRNSLARTSRKPALRNQPRHLQQTGPDAAEPAPSPHRGSAASTARHASSSIFSSPSSVLPADHHLRTHRQPLPQHASSTRSRLPPARHTSNSPSPAPAPPEHQSPPAAPPSPHSAPETAKSSPATAATSRRSRIYRGNDRSDTRAFTTATGTPACAHSSISLGQSSLSISTSIFGRSTPRYRRTTNRKSSGR